MWVVAAALKTLGFLSFVLYGQEWGIVLMLAGWYVLDFYYRRQFKKEVL